MSVITQLKDTEKYPVFFHRDVCNFLFDVPSGFLLESDLTPGSLNINESNVFLSEEEKIFVRLDFSVYHFLHDDLGLILYYHEHYPNAKFIIDISIVQEFWNNPSFDMFKFSLKALSSFGISYELVNLKGNKLVNARNFYSFESMNEAYRTLAPKRIFELFRPYIDNPDEEPYRLVYLSRKLAANKNSYQDEMPGFEVFNDNRMNDHKAIEDFFYSQGYEIVYAEKFSNFREQLNYFYSVKTLASITGSGLVNAAFMRDGQNVIELLTPLQMMLFSQEDLQEVAKATESNMLSEKRAWLEEFHHFYQILSIKKGHAYLAINNISRNASEVVSSLQKIFLNFSNNGNFKLDKQSGVSK